MVNPPNFQAATNYRLSWPAIFWRLLLTLLLLLMLVGPGLNLFSAVTATPDSQVLPPLSQEGARGK